MARKALIIGINYTGTRYELQGCINDAKQVRELLLTKGYLNENITLITDDTDEKPTRRVILQRLLELITSDASKLFFHYSGHGSSIKDEDGDENDGRDETLVPIDHSDIGGGLIIDDEIRGLLTCLRKGKKLTCLLDCCHSGTGMDLCYELFQNVGNGILRLMRNNKYKKTSGECIMISGCQDNQQSADAYMEGKFQGAMTYAFLEIISSGPKTYSQLITGMRHLLKNKGYDQIPNLSSGKELNLSKQVLF